MLVSKARNLAWYSPLTTFNIVKVKVIPGMVTTNILSTRTSHNRFLLRERMRSTVIDLLFESFRRKTLMSLLIDGAKSVFKDKC